MKNLKFEDLPNAVELILEKLNMLQSEINSLNENFQPKELIELMSREETANFFQISYPTLNNWTKNGILTGYRVGNRIYYKRSEIESQVQKII
ncbi:helix-turn-helix domain-containing protein [Cellulophaga baltica]|uniref:DNA-binding protein n=1 Tax=Cellulophaga baltica 18 TaxID=1348584 RepID=A0AAU8RU65_9FLAO|nr:helix-turn-helix domain-containing protein [Cellulophaga baltica]AIZ41219.1 DNA-binding protein [Cellulophaga baltica 18]